MFVALPVVMSCHREPEAVISGTLAPAKGKMVYLDKMDIDKAVPVDSVKAGRNGKFRFRVAVDEPTFFLLKVSDNNFITLLTGPGEKVVVTADSAFLPAGYTVKGSEGSLLVKQLDDRLRETVRRTDSIARIYRENMGKPGFDTLKVRLDREYNDLIQAQRKYTIGFILEHLKSPASIKALYQKIDGNTYVLYDLKDLQYMKIVADTLKVYYPEAKITRALVQDLNKEMSKYNELRLQSMIKEARTVDLDISLPDVKGDTVTLSSLWKKGDYVLLTFWASWCQQCITENLQLKALYKKYHPKGFEIYAVSLDKQQEPWLKQVRFDELPWVNVRDAAGEAAGRYNVSMPPVNFLYGPDGQVLGRDLHGRALQIKLSQIFD
jgi:peroxiredoxin